MEENNYEEFGLMWDDDHKCLMGGCFAPNGDWYLSLQSVDPFDGVRSFPLNFRISLSGSHIPDELKHKLIDIIKELPHHEDL